MKITGLVDIIQNLMGYGIVAADQRLTNVIPLFNKGQKAVRYSEEYQLKGNAKVYYCKGNDKGTKDTLARGLENVHVNLCKENVV